jgi:hypothetical protein
MIWLSVNLERFNVELPYELNPTSEVIAFAGGLPSAKQAVHQYRQLSGFRLLC